MRFSKIISNKIDFIVHAELHGLHRDPPAWELTQTHAVLSQNTE